MQGSVMSWSAFKCGTKSYMLVEMNDMQVVKGIYIEITRDLLGCRIDRTKDSFTLVLINFETSHECYYS